MNYFFNLVGYNGEVVLTLKPIRRRRRTVRKTVNVLGLRETHQVDEHEAILREASGTEERAKGQALLWSCKSCDERAFPGRLLSR